MISENILKRLGGSLALNRARTIAARGYPIFNRRLSYRKHLTVLHASIDDATTSTGSVDASITVDESNGSVAGYACGCAEAARADRTGPCKHCMAVALDYNRNMRSYEGYDPTRFIKTSSCIADYLDRATPALRVRAGTDGDDRGSIDFSLELAYDLGAWNARFKIRGAHGSYILPSISDVLDNVKAGEYVSYGKKLGFVHAPDAFSAHGRDVLAFLDRALASRRTMDAHAQWGFGLRRIERDLHISPPEIDELVRLFEEEGFRLRDGSKETSRGRAMHVVEADPPLSIVVKPLGENGFELVRSGQVRFVDCGRTLYAWKGDAFYRCSPAMRAAADFLLDVYASPVRQLLLTEDDAERFVPLVAASLDGAIDVRLPPQLEELRPRPCALEFYIDRGAGGVECRPVAAYGSQSHGLFATLGRQDYADETAEAPARDIVRRYFPEIGEDGVCVIPDDETDALGRLAFEGVSELQRIGEVFATPEFNRLASSARPSVSVGLSLKSSLIDVSFEVEGMPADELSALLASYRRRKDYHRLKDGTLIRIAGVDLARIDEAASLINASKAQLDAGHATAPAFDAFALDALADDDAKDASFVAWMDAFKTIDEDAYRVPDGLAATLRPYQEAGFRWMSHLMDLGFGGILADEMGLGKTLQLICLLLARRDEARATGPSLVVCPASLVYNWAAEFERFAPDLRIAVVAGDADVRAEARRRADADVFITSYDLLKRDIEDYAGMRFWCEALDEAQYVKNHETQAAASVKAIDAAHRIALTGTPIENRVSEVWSIFDYLMPGLLGSYTRFRDRFEAPIMDGDEEAAARLSALVGPFILRRRKADVLTDLPEKWESVVYARLEGEQRALYQAHEQMLRMKIAHEGEEGDDGRSKVEILAELTRLRQIALDPSLLYADYRGGGAKEQAIMDTIASCIASGEKMLVFSQFTSYLDIIGAKLSEQGVKHYVITGSTPKKKRLALVDAFNADDTPVFLISLKAGGTGLNLTGASVVLHADPWWNAAAQNQATDRAHRMGQTRIVNVYRVIAKDTIEERILKLQDAKSDLADRIVGSGGGTSLASLTKEDLLDLLG